MRGLTRYFQGSQRGLPNGYRATSRPRTVGAYIERAAEAGLTWAEAESLTEAQVEGRLFTYVGRSEPQASAAIDFDWVRRELPRIGVTLQLLWGEYQLAAREVQVLPYQYSQFCELYAARRNQRRLRIRQTHRPRAHRTDQLPTSTFSAARGALG
jgi:transposase